MLNIVKRIGLLILVILIYVPSAHTEEQLQQVYGGENRAVATELIPGVMYSAKGNVPGFTSDPGERDGDWYVINTQGFDWCTIHYPIITKEDTQWFEVFNERGEYIEQTKMMSQNEEGDVHFAIDGNSKIYLQIFFTMHSGNSVFEFCLDGDEKNTHKWMDVPDGKALEVEATCAEEGSYCTQKCMICDTYSGIQTIPKLPHTPGDWMTETAATCTNAGTEACYCTVCGEQLETREIPASGHSIGEWSVETAATCTNPGLEARYCEKCGELMVSREIAATGHQISDWIVAQAAGCQYSGMREKYCTICGTIMETEMIPATGHVYTDWTTTREASWEEEGEKSRHCIYCGDTQFEAIPKRNIFSIFS